MKVVMVETGGFGGIAHYAYNLSRALAHGGTELVLLTTRDYELDGYETPFKLRNELPEGGDRAGGLVALRSTLEDEQPDLVHFQSIWSPRRDWLWTRPPHRRWRRRRGRSSTVSCKSRCRGSCRPSLPGTGS